ncbi:hypothetical protein GCM10022231_27900 [Gordonia caeni]|uniref:L,D-TPase catalytic domain-containing protein n=2 Tax=Gordonia caeni TaxID=1007097 RepID=A0ABP7PH68_9ACTN
MARVWFRWHTEVVLKLLMSRMWQLGLVVLAAVVAVAAVPATAFAEPTTPTTPTPTPSPSSPSTPDVQSMLENLLRGFSLPGLPDQGDPVGDTSQMIVVSVPEAAATTGTLTAFEKDANGQWKPVIGPTQAWVGSKGIGKPEDNVHRTPEGTFALGQAFGRLDNPGTKLPYKKVDNQDWWDGNMQSATYNRMIRQPNNPGGGSENLYDMGPAYDYAVEVKHNPTNTPGNASAIFLHVGSEPTWGCIAIGKEQMMEILKWLDPAKNPKISIGVNQESPKDIKDAPSLADPQGTPLGDDALSSILSEFTPLIPQLMDTVTGSS